MGIPQWKIRTEMWHLFSGVSQRLQYLFLIMPRHLKWLILRIAGLTRQPRLSWMMNWTVLPKSTVSNNAAAPCAHGWLRTGQCHWRFSHRLGTLYWTMTFAFSWIHNFQDKIPYFINSTNILVRSPWSLFFVISLPQKFKQPNSWSVGSSNKLVERKTILPPIWWCLQV